jgi:MFS family permease
MAHVYGRVMEPGPRLLRERTFRLLWTGQAISGFGSALVPVALAFSLVELTSSASALGLVLTAGFATRIVFLPLGGVVADRLPRQHVMVAADGVRAATEALVALLLLSGVARPWQLACLYAVYGAADAFFSPASVALATETVPRGLLQQANALMNLPNSAAAVLCPALAGLLVAVLTPGVVIGLDAATFVVSAVTLAALRLPPRARTVSEPNLLGELHAGWRELAARSWVWGGIAYFSVANFAIAPLYVLGPFVAEEKLGGALGWGLIATCGGIGAVAGDVAAMRFRPRRALAPGFLLVAVWALEPALLAKPFPAVVIAAAAAVGFGALAFSNAMWLTALQELIPPESLARVSSFDWLGSRAFQPAGYALAGPLAAVIGIPATLAAGAAAHASASVAIALTPAVRRLERPSLDR